MTLKKTMSKSSESPLQYHPLNIFRFLNMGSWSILVIRSLGWGSKSEAARGYGEPGRPSLWMTLGMRMSGEAPKTSYDI